MPHPSLVLNSPRNRAQAHRWIDTASDKVRVVFKEGDTRSEEQNRMMWPLLSIIAKNVQWYGYWLSTNDWKLIFLEALERQLVAEEKMGLCVVPNLNGDGFVQIGGSSKVLKVGQFSMLLEAILAFGAEQGLDMEDPRNPTQNKPEAA